MLTGRSDFTVIAEINPPEMPDMVHRELAGNWRDVLVTDNVFGRIRVSPYAFAARITHDVPAVHPTVVVSTRDRNILAIESEVRGALGNGVDSFLVVVGDTVPQVDHMSHHHEIVEHLRNLENRVDVPFEVGMPVRFRRWQLERRIALGAQFFTVGPVIDPLTVAPSLDLLGRRTADPPVFLMVVPPFGLSWVERAEGWGSVPAGEEMRKALADYTGDVRSYAWEQASAVVDQARQAGCSGVVLSGLRFDTMVGEAAEWMRSLGLNDPRPTPPSHHH